MHRRRAITALLTLGAAVGLPGVRAATPFRIALLPDLDPESRQAFTLAMEKAGWIEDEHYIVEASTLKAGMHLQPVLTRMVSAPRPLTEGDMETGTRQLVARKPDLIFATSTAYARAAPQIPVVMWTGGYPVEAGIAESLARPGRNLTGATIYAGTGVWGKLLELLRDSKPDLRRVGVLWDYGPPAFPREEVEPCHRELERAAQALRLQLRIVEVAHGDDLDAALAALDGEALGALVVTSGWETAPARSRIMEYAARRRLPVAVDFRWRSTVDPYPLIVYSARQAELMQVAASYTVKILQGARAGELPIQQPTRFELVINLRTARRLGMALPQSLLIRADEVVR